MVFFSKKVVPYFKLFIILWLLAFAFLGFSAIKLPALLGGDGFEAEGEFKNVEKELTSTFDRPNSTILILFEKQPDESEHIFHSKISNKLKEIKNLHIAKAIQSPLAEKQLIKGDLAYAIVAFDKEKEELKDEIKSIRNLTKEDSSIKLTGVPIINQDFNKASQDDLKRAELIGLPFAVVVLILAFGSVVASIVPIAVGAITVVASFGVLALVGNSLNLSVFILNIVPMIGLALSIDFSLLFINRYREEAVHSNHGKAIEKTILTAGRSILFSAFCVFIGLAAMMVIDIDIFQTVAIGGMVVVGISVLSSLTLLPSILMLLGKNINKWSILNVSDKNTAGWRKFAAQVMQRPVTITLLSIILLLIGMIPVKDINLVIPKADSLPKGYESRIAYEKIQSRFNMKNESTVFAVAERKGEWLDDRGLTYMENLVGKFKHDQLVSNVETIFSATGLTPQQLRTALSQQKNREQMSPAIDHFVKGGKLLIPITLKVNDTSDSAKKWVRNWSTGNSQYKLSFGGSPKFNQEIFDEIFDKIPLVLAIILISTLIILTIAFRSIIIPVKAIIMNILGLSSTFGILVWIFQYGHFGLPKTDISLIIPVLVFSLVFGLSMDYEVFLISRIQEIYLETGDNDYATTEGLASTSKIITSAALIMIVITGAFAFTGVVPVKQIGVGIAIAILIDATVIRLLLVPSLMKLLGEWNWWLPFIKRKNVKKLTN
jgi:putative drug exporter of the RND superfamily